MPLLSVAINELDAMDFYATTERLLLRALLREELPRLVDLIGSWDVVRWLSVVPFPYTLSHGEEFYADMEDFYTKGEPQFYALALKTDSLLIGGIGLHPPRSLSYAEGEIEIGYWLGRDYWGCGLMSEAARAIIDIGFARSSTQSIVATTDPNNFASQKVLHKIGLRKLGTTKRDYKTLRGGDQIIKWQLTRAEFEKDKIG